ncbi:hypothetical protein JVT61DRAFT_10247 [Boletus reticuloceps]|uniref:Uncharacterized protein n=1 Tax=Boletus reticuloceps TaxID=495285 RepID=A0A8I3AEQ7_9AGAM|nr:hypothetical protein JVT61DRAFT_10247 [Boletus reticuloceps]
MGVSIPSQQRWLFYWSQVLAGKGPPSLRLFQPNDHPERQQDLLEQSPQITKVKLTKLTVRMREPAGIQPHLVQAASVAITSAGKGRAMSESTTGKLWACLARYNDRLVDGTRTLGEKVTQPGWCNTVQSLQERSMGQDKDDTEFCSDGHIRHPADSTKSNCMCYHFPI